ncbi:hypothetical protein DER46DRAFT_597502 [Fusarium sp. MPI-SDFR-AT-0072]|nr:hypothetical protein DER46DRAFT_597502 [Fusarium sp. MPI-SDFR-AT-0072]
MKYQVSFTWNCHALSSHVLSLSCSHSPQRNSLGLGATSRSRPPQPVSRDIRSFRHLTQVRDAILPRDNSGTRHVLGETDVFVMTRQTRQGTFLLGGLYKLKGAEVPPTVSHSTGSTFMNATCVNHLQRHFRNRQNLRITLQQSKTHIFISG